MFSIEMDSSALEKRLKQMEKDSPAAAEEVIKQLGAIAHKAARSFVPVDTGALKGSLTLTVKKIGAESSAEIVSLLDYAAPIEYGSSRGAPQPFMRPALKETQNQIESVSEAVLKRL